MGRTKSRTFFGPPRSDPSRLKMRKISSDQADTPEPGSGSAHPYLNKEENQCLKDLKQ